MIKKDREHKGSIARAVMAAYSIGDSYNTSPFLGESARTIRMGKARWIITDNPHYKDYDFVSDTESERRFVSALYMDAKDNKVNVIAENPDIYEFIDTLGILHRDILEKPFFALRDMHFFKNLKTWKSPYEFSGGMSFLSTVGALSLADVANGFIQGGTHILAPEVLEGYASVMKFMDASVYDGLVLFCVGAFAAAYGIKKGAGFLENKLDERRVRNIPENAESYFYGKEVNQLYKDVVENKREHLRMKDAYHQAPASLKKLDRKAFHDVYTTVQEESRNPVDAARDGVERVLVKTKKEIPAGDLAWLFHETG